MAQIVGETPEIVESLVAELAGDYDEVVSGLTPRRVADGYVLLAKPACLARLEKFLKPRPPLSPAALETLALIAYGQPVTAAEVMETRGVHTSGILETLLARKQIRAAARQSNPLSNDPGIAAGIWAGGP